MVACGQQDCLKVSDCSFKSETVLSSQEWIFYFSKILLWWALIGAEYWSTYSPCFPLYCCVGKLGSSGRARKCFNELKVSFQGLADAKPLFLQSLSLVAAHGGSLELNMFLVGVRCLKPNKLVMAQSGNPPRPTPLAAPLLYQGHSCHRCLCHTSYRWWGIPSMENRIATVEWPSCRGRWGASHRSDRFELFSKISLIYQLHIYIKFFGFILKSWILDGIYMKWRLAAFRGLASSWVSCFPSLEAQPFSPASHRSTVTASLSCCVPQWWLHNFKVVLSIKVWSWRTRRTSFAAVFSTCWVGIDINMLFLRCFGPICWRNGYD